MNKCYGVFCEVIRNPQNLFAKLVYKFVKSVMENVFLEDKKEQLNVAIPRYLYQKIEEEVARQGITKRKLVFQLLSKAFEEKSISEGSSNDSEIKVPDFIFDNNDINKELYEYIKSNPKSSRFIYKKYKDNQSFIRELCDPDNPIYLREVAENLRDIFDYKEMEIDLEKLRKHIYESQIEKDKIDDELREMKNNYDEIEENLKKIKTELSDFERQKSNIRTDVALEKINGVFDSIIKIAQSITSKWNEKIKQNPLESSLRIERDTINALELIAKSTLETKYIFKTEDFLSPDNLDKYHREQLQKLELEKENAMNEMNSYMLHNPKKIIIKSLDSLGLVVDKLNKAEDDGAGGVYLRRFLKGNIEGELTEVSKLLSHLEDQVENVERRKK